MALIGKRECFKGEIQRERQCVCVCGVCVYGRRDKKNGKLKNNW